MFRFTIRDVLWLTVVVSICIAWWVDKRPRPGVMTDVFIHDGFHKGEPIRLFREVRRWQEPRKVDRLGRNVYE